MRGLNFPVFEIPKPAGSILPDYKPTNINEIPCHETLSNFIAPEASKRGWDHRQLPLREMVENDLSDGHGAKEIEERFDMLDKMVEIVEEMEMPLATKKSGNNVSRVDRGVKTNIQNLIRGAGVEAFHVVWNVMISSKESEEEKGKKLNKKREREGRQMERKKQKQRINDMEPLIRIRCEFEKNEGDKLVSSEERIMEFIVGYEKKIKGFNRRWRKKEISEISEIRNAKRPKEEIEKMVAEVEQRHSWRKDQLILDSELGRHFIGYLFPVTHQLLLLDTWKEISAVECVVKSHLDDSFPIAMMMRFNCTKEICSTPEWLELATMMDLLDFDEHRNQAIVERAKLAGCVILKSWSAKKHPFVACGIFLRHAIDADLISLCLKRINKKSDLTELEEEIETIREIEIDFNELVGDSMQERH